MVRRRPATNAVGYKSLLILAICLGQIVFVARSVSASEACPFCSAVNQTLAEEIVTNDAVVIAKMLPFDESKRAKLDGNDDVTQGEFEIVTVLKGNDHHAVGTKIKSVVFGQAAEDDLFLLLGVDPPLTMWATPIALSDREVDYVKTLPSLPETGPKRMEFFVKHLEDPSSLLAADAYDEFARAPYSDVVAIKESMDHGKLVKWIKNEDIPASRKRLYLTMLGICGSSMDIPFLEELMNSPERRKRAGLDAMIACYLTLKGESGLQLVDDLFLSNEEAEYADTYAAITALRFHGSEEDTLPKERILRSMELMLKRPRLADLVIPDLARWKDWEVMDELVQLFKDADDSTNWVRVPVVNYLRACPLPEAKEHLKELEKIDPDAIKRANTFFPLIDSGTNDSDASDTDDGGETEAEVKKSTSEEATQTKEPDSKESDQSAVRVETRKPALSEDRDAAAGIDFDADRGNAAGELLELLASDASDLTAETEDDSTEFVTTVAPIVGDQASNGDAANNQTAQIDSDAGLAAPAAATNLSLSPLMLLSSATLVCTMILAILWGLLTGQLVSLIS